MSEIVFMGLLLNKHGVGSPEKRSEPFVKQNPPTNVAELRSFLGLISFSSRFPPNFATTAEPLRKLTRKDIKCRGAWRKALGDF